MTNTSVTSNTSDILSVLEEFGFTHNEAVVYLNLLQLDQTTAGPLVRRCKLHRQFVYSALERLEAQGFVSHVLRNNRKNFYASKPDLLLQRENERQRKIKSILPQLSALGTKGDDKIHVQVLSGQEEFFNNLLTVVDSASKFDKVVRIIGGGRDMSLYGYMGNRYSEYVKYAKEKKIKKHLIAPGPAGRELKERFLAESRAEFRFLKHGLSTPSYTRITPELVTTEIFGLDVVVVQIWNKIVAKSYLEHFDLLWKTAQRYKITKK